MATVNPTPKGGKEEEEDAQNFTGELPQETSAPKKLDAGALFVLKSKGINTQPNHHDFLLTSSLFLGHPAPCSAANPTAASASISCTHLNLNADALIACHCSAPPVPFLNHSLLQIGLFKRENRTQKIPFKREPPSRFGNE
ncbi:hypothetical protein KSP40_PGU009225 [Platanthera guangdongensis]|uniref:Uncharacterized protein n=1 Tax=Platanthera guangdongensis TaxID=2320717 RepID=A0ABR2MWS7_9ASPA